MVKRKATSKPATKKVVRKISVGTKKKNIAAPKHTVTTVKKPAVKRLAVKSKEPIQRKKSRKKITSSLRTAPRANKIVNRQSSIQQSKRVVIIGAGKVAHAFAALFTEIGWKIDGVVARSGVTASSLARKCGAKVMKLGKDRIEANIVLLAVSDTSVKRVGEQLYSMMPVGSTLIFTGGSSSRKDFPLLVARKVHVVGLHPIQTFTDKIFSSDRLKNITFGLEATPADRKLVEPIVKAVNGQTISVPTDRKVLYHAAIVMAANLYVGLWSRTEKVFSAAGIAAQDIRKAVVPLVRQTVENIFSSVSSLPFSGPISRSDVSTIAKQLKSLRLLPRAKKLYKTLSSELVRLGERQKEFSKKEIKNLKKLLK